MRDISTYRPESRLLQTMYPPFIKVLICLSMMRMKRLQNASTPKHVGLPDTLQFFRKSKWRE